VSTRAAPGPQLSTGRLRVDAARAIAKLREYQLVDRTAWVLEAIRAGVASGATKLTLSSDANDIWLVWDGPAWPADDLPKLFDELVSPEPTEERHHLRLLAAAVNSALGTDPAYVDLYAVSPDITLRARYTPDVLVETAELEDSPLRKIAAEPASAPGNLAPETGMLVHVRRRTAIGMLTYLFWEREQPELATARAACRDLAVPITIGSTTYCRDQLGDDLVRMELGGDLDGYVAIRDPDAPRPAFPDATLEIAERGVLLATYPLAIAPGGGSSTDLELRGPVPVRVFVDAKRMPTNASRSQVRREVPPISTAERRGPEQAAKLIADLAKEVGEPGCDERKRKAACALVASVISGNEWSTQCFSLQVGAFGKLELLRDAAGIPRPLRHAWSGHVYTGKDHVDPALGPWVSSIAWIPRGDPAARIVAGAAIDQSQTKSRIAWAKKQYKAHKKFFAHAARPAALAVKRTPRVRITLGHKLAGSCVPPSRFDKLTGEIGVSFERGDGELLLMFQGRPIERITMLSPLGFDAVVDAVELTPGDKFKSVARDAQFRCVELGIQAALVCAAEVIASELLGDCELPAGITVGPKSTPDVEARAVRLGLVIAHELNLVRSTMLSKAPAWRTFDGRWIEFYELARHDVIGFASGVHRFTPPAGRLILMGAKEQVAKLLPNARLVDYDKRRTSSDDRVERPGRLAASLAASHGFALAIAGDDVCGAIAPAMRSAIQLHHIGCALDTRERVSSLAPCAIVADSDAIVPDVEWKAAGDTAGVHDRDFRAWEAELVRAAIAALAGERPLELHGPEIQIESQLATWALCVLARDHEPPIFDRPTHAALLERFKKAPVLHVLGERDLISIETLVKRSPSTIYFVPRTAAPVAGFAPLVADPEVAAGIGALAGVEVTDGTAELEIRRKAAMRDARLATHRALPERAFTYPFAGSPHVEIDRAANKFAGKGLVGIGRNRLEIDVRIEGRTFATLTRQGGLPLYAVVDLDLSNANDELTGLSELVTSQLFQIVRRTAPALLLSIATSDPTSLGDLSAARTLLRAALEDAEVMSPVLRDQLRKVPAFSTIQGGRTSVASASSANGILSIADWQSDWLSPADGEPVDAVDQDVLRVTDEHGELPELLRRLAFSVVDVSDEASKLQSRRRMARGLVPVPALPHVPNELKRKLSELGAIGQRLGHGEIGLVDGVSCALIHDHGVLRQRMTLDVVPGIQLAIEAPELVDADAELPRDVDTRGSVADQLARLRDLTGRSAKAGPSSLASDAQELAELLLTAVFAAGHGEGLDVAYKQSIRRALIAKRISPDTVTIPIFELLDGRWVGLDVLDAQIAKHGNAWAVSAPTGKRPLDDERLVFLFGSDELSAAYGKYAVIDATNELDLDHRARKNRDRERARTLGIAGRDYLLTTIELDGDGITKPRGVVAPLMPHAAGQRGLYTHKEMVPFELMTDPCKWPTLAMVDDARLEPDRTWEKPRTTTTSWADVTVRVGAASERALAALVPRQPDALAQINVTSSTSLGPLALRSKLQIRGAAWLRAAPRPPVFAILVFDSYGRHEYVPERPLGLGGMLYVHAPEGWDRAGTLAEVVPRLHGHLMRQLLGRKSVSQDLIAAHLATALAMGTINPSDLGSVKFPCFRPAPLDGIQLAKLFTDGEPVRVLSLVDVETELLEADAEGLVEDGSELSQAVLTQLGPRVRYGALPRKKKKPAMPEITVAPEMPAFTVEPAKPAPVERAKAVELPKPARAHPIQNVVDAVSRRLLDLGVPAFSFAIGDFEGTMVIYDRHELRFAGAHRRLHAIGNALRANSPWAPLAIDALAAHVITVLDQARSEINAQTVQDVLAAILLDA
jgi:hypothetical protein